MNDIKIAEAVAFINEETKDNHIRNVVKARVIYRGKPEAGVFTPFRYGWQVGVEIGQWDESLWGEEYHSIWMETPQQADLHNDKIQDRISNMACQMCCSVKWIF